MTIISCTVATQCTGYAGINFGDGAAYDTKAFSGTFAYFHYGAEFRLQQYCTGNNLHLMNMNSSGATNGLMIGFNNMEVRCFFIFREFFIFKCVEISKI